jgi:hypothetical protein
MIDEFTFLGIGVLLCMGQAITNVLRMRRLERHVIDWLMQLDAREQKTSMDLEDLKARIGSAELPR